LLNKICFSIPANNIEYDKLFSEEKVIWLTKKNIEHSISEIRNRSGILRDLEVNKDIKIVGGIYDVGTGEVNFNL
jgi:carbonic anhydrase